jgi:DNA-binding MarR family transcriptional regulator
MATEPGPQEWATGRLLSTAARLVEQAWNNRLREHGVSHAGLIVMSTLGRGASSQRDLAEDQHVTEQTIGRTIAHLESTGHVVRRADQTDRRRRSVELTESGAALLAEMFDTGERITDDILRANGVDVARFRESLTTLIEAMDPSGAQVADLQRTMPDDGPAMDGSPDDAAAADRSAGVAAADRPVGQGAPDDRAAGQGPPDGRTAGQGPADDRAAGHGPAELRVS